MISNKYCRRGSVSVFGSLSPRGSGLGASAVGAAALGVSALLLILGQAPHAWASAPATERSGEPPCGYSPPTGDFNIPPGDGGMNRFSALGAPLRTVAGTPHAGAVDIRLTHGVPIPTVVNSFALGRPVEADARFGAAVASAPVNSGDSCNDLIIGMPGAQQGRGAVVVVPGTPTGFQPEAALWLPVADLGLQPGDALGTSLTALDTQSGTLIVAGAPGADTAGAANAGELVTWLIPTGGAAMTIPAPTVTKTYRQGAGRVSGRSEKGDGFGAVFAPRHLGKNNVLTVGIPGEDIGGAKDAGAVAQLTFTDPEATLARSSMMWAGHGLPGRPRTGDRLGAAVTTYYGRLAGVGVPGRDADGKRDSGAIITNINGRGMEVLTQDSPQVPDRSEAGDHFGASLVRAVIPAQLDVVGIGAPGEDAAVGRDAGSVTFYSNARSPGHTVTGAASGDELGSSLIILSDNTYEEDREDILLGGAPGCDTTEHANAGAYLALDQQGILSSPLSGSGTQAGESYGK